jgi:hypothetical protein
MALIQVPPVQTGSMTLLSTTSLSGVTITVSGISQAYKHLYCELQNPTWATGIMIPYFRIDGTIGFQGNRFNRTGTGSGNSGNANILCWDTQSSNTAGDGVAALTINNYASTTATKIYYCAGGENTTGQYLYTQAGFIQSTAAITQIQIHSNQLYSYNGGTLRIYGVN